MVGRAEGDEIGISIYTECHAPIEISLFKVFKDHDTVVNGSNDLPRMLTPPSCFGPQWRFRGCSILVLGLYSFMFVQGHVCPGHSLDRVTHSAKTGRDCN